MVARLVQVALGLGTRIRVGPELNNQIAISLLLILTLGSVNFGILRLVETAVGGGVGVLVSMLRWPPHPVRGLTERVERVRCQMQEDLPKTAQALLSTQQGKAVVERVRRDPAAALMLPAEASEAERAFRGNPLR